MRADQRAAQDIGYRASQTKSCELFSQRLCITDVLSGERHDDPLPKSVERRIGDFELPERVLDIVKEFGMEEQDRDQNGLGLDSTARGLRPRVPIS